MIVWNDKVIKNRMQCTECGIKFLTETGWPVNVMVFSDRKKGYCKRCGTEVCRLSERKD